MPELPASRIDHTRSRQRSTALILTSTQRDPPPRSGDTSVEDCDTWQNIAGLRGSPQDQLGAWTGEMGVPTPDAKVGVS